MRRCANGLSMVELLVVLVIAGLLMGMAMPALRDLIERHQLETATADLFGAIDLARSQAIARGRRVTLAPLDPAGADWARGWVVFVDRNGDRRPGPLDEVISSRGEVPEGMVATFAFTSGTAPYYIAFNGAGRSCSHASSLASRFGTLSLHYAGQIRRIKVNMQGRVRVCNPARDGAACGAEQGG